MFVINNGGDLVEEFWGLVVDKIEISNYYNFYCGIQGVEPW